MQHTIELLNAKVHLRNTFVNQHISLQNYIRSIARQDVDRDLARCFVLVDDEKIIKGYYTLNNLPIPAADWDEQLRKKFKLSYPSIPCTLIGRLAVDAHQQGNRYGEILLMDALFRAFEVSKTIASFAVVVDSIDSSAKAFYKKYEFCELTDTDRLFLTMKTISQLFK